jgi:hypothetical protein
MRMESILEVTAQATAVGPMGPEAAQAVTLCRIQPRPVAEIAAVLGLPVTITKIILSDLMQRGVLTPAVPRTTTGRLDKEQALEALLAGLRSMSDVA